MDKKKVLFISQEMLPFVPEDKVMEQSLMARVSRELPQGIQELGGEIRTFMPRYACVNERRHQLHEVIRLSGMNIIIDDTDHPLIIKVASIQAARMQVYFIDNEDFFSQKVTVKDLEGNELEDNDIKSVFFARGVLETVKKLRWTPDIIHCHGWMTSSVPLLIKKIYSQDVFFEKSKIIYTLYNDAFQKPFAAGLGNKIKMPGIEDEDVALVDEATYTNVSKLGIDSSDAVICGDAEVDQEALEYARSKGLPVMEFPGDEDFINKYDEFYNALLEV